MTKTLQYCVPPWILLLDVLKQNAGETDVLPRHNLIDQRRKLLLSSLYQTDLF